MRNNISARTIEWRTQSGNPPQSLQTHCNRKRWPSSLRISGRFFAQELKCRMDTRGPVCIKWFNKSLISDDICCQLLLCRGVFPDFWKKSELHFLKKFRMGKKILTKDFRKFCEKLQTRKKFPIRIEFPKKFNSSKNESWKFSTKSSVSFFLHFFFRIKMSNSAKKSVCPPGGGS